MNKYVSLLAVLCIAMSKAGGQNITTGTIKDAVTQHAVQGATVSNVHDKTKTISDKNGYFSLPENADSVLITCIGYESIKYATKEKGLNNNVSISLIPTFTNLNEVVITGSREKQKRTEVPVAIDVITKKELNETKATRIDMLINKVPGVFMVDLGNEQHSMSVRQPLGYNSLFLYLEDGIPIRTVGDFNHNALIEINQASLQRIEVVKGPASSLYGSDAIGGAINFITESPSPYLTSKIEFSANSRGYKRTNFSASNTFKKLGLYFGGYIADQKQPKDQHNNFDKTALTMRADYTWNDNLKLTAVADYIKYKTDQKGGLDSAHFYDKNYSNFYRFTYRRVDAFRLRTTLHKKWNDNSNTNITLFYRNNSIGQNPFYSIANVRENPYQATGQINDDAFHSYGTVIQQTNKIPSWRVKWINGISADYSPATYHAGFIRVHRTPDGIYDSYQKTDSVLTDYRVGLLNTAAYSQVEYNPFTKLRIVLAARYDRLDYDFDNHLPPGAYSGAPDAVNHFDHFTPKVGFTYDFGKGRGMYVNYSVGFAPPDINDLYRGVQVPVLKPSSYKNYEMGGWFAFANNTASAEFSIYQMDGKDEIVSTRLSDGSYINENAGITSHKGIEMNVKYQPVKEVTFRIGGTVAKHRFVNYIQQGKNFSGNEMPQSPSYILNGEVSYKPAFLRGFRISSETESLGSYFTDPQNTARYNGFTIFNLRSGYEIKGFEIWVNWLNVTNRNYAVTVEKSAYGTSYRPGELSTITVGVGYRFNKK